MLAATERARDIMDYRGPDDCGLWRSDDRAAIFGHRRLSILDLSSAGHQPMSNEDGTVWICYNGEVYNFPEIREDLLARGHVFHSHTDTEVIIHGYEEYGPEIVERLRGMVAFALYDGRRRRLVMARDRLGIKPLYYTRVGNNLIFGSEIKSLLEYPMVEKGIDTFSMREYLAFGKSYGPGTMFKGISKFPVAHFAVMEDGGELTFRKYWTPYQHRLEFPADADEGYFRQQLLERLQESVRLRMVSDVPVGVFLSGGVDSTANVAMMSAISGGGVRTFTAGFRGQESYDEREIARRASAYYNTKHEEVEITREDLTRVLPDLAFYLDEPVSDPTVIPIYFISKLARQSGTIVILNGDGADEVFCGYRKYMKYLNLLPYWRALNVLPAPLKGSFAKLGRRVGVQGAASDILERSARGLQLYIGGTSALKETEAYDEIIKQNGHGDLFAAVRRGYDAFNGERGSSDYAEWLSYWGVLSEVEPIFLYRADRIGMANSIEIRVPFLDHKLVEFAMQMPQHLKYRDGEAKYILKKALEGTVPNEFLYRKKQGFAVPVREWAGDMLNSKIAEILPRMQKEWGGISPEFVSIINARLGNASAADRNGFLAWNLYSLVTWYERWFLN
jgi:asparagine synthase (glutamine-hydrolysing)